MESKTNQNQIVIKTNPEDAKQKLPLFLILTLAAGTIAGIVIIFAVIWGIEKLIGF